METWIQELWESLPPDKKKVWTPEVIQRLSKDMGLDREEIMERDELDDEEDEKERNSRLKDEFIMGVYKMAFPDMVMEE